MCVHNFSRDEIFANQHMTAKNANIPRVRLGGSLKPSCWIFDLKRYGTAAIRRRGQDTDLEKQ